LLLLLPPLLNQRGLLRRDEVGQGDEVGQVDIDGCIVGVVVFHQRRHVVR